MRQAGSAKRPGKLTADDWVDAAYSAMAEDGVGAVAVEPLARRLGVTRGSFYWHFKDRRSLVEAVLERWEEESTEATISATGLIPDPGERLVRLAEESFGEVPQDDASLGGTVLRWRAFDLAVSDAAEDPIVRPFLRRVTERRIGYLEECYRGLGLPSEKARHMALLAYTAHAGTVRLLRDLPERIPRGDAYLAYRRHLVETLVPQGAEGDPRVG
ncbi:MAG TPA: TetR/AcrR family transcriptional regulator [Rubrobacter sp.]|jgi:AcrR family transcriptional regulator|nr:TetR/AcrR family transcriptional regulator [Rubrobacter sp.]